jgi:hypothetical protein
MFWRGGYTLRGEVGRCWALEFPSFLGPVKWHRADRRVPFGAQIFDLVFSYISFFLGPLREGQTQMNVQKCIVRFKKFLY